MFVFGSSIMDNGNNNFLNTAIKANYLPYGIDLPFGKNGSRFTNGKNFADRVGDLVKLPLLPAFSDPRTRGVASFHGVNHASAGSGILDVTGSNMVFPPSLFILYAFLIIENDKGRNMRPLSRVTMMT
ncbi:hypothetical protein SOVF_121360 [Spinacia oleracea]|nr:hypothetical protein SOVF_121360 [Spinacia oleracea]